MKVFRCPPRLMRAILLVGLLSVVSLASVTIAAHRSGAAQEHPLGAARGHANIEMSLAKSFPTWGDLKGASSLIVIGTAVQQHASTSVQAAMGFPQVPGQNAAPPWTTTAIRVDRILKDNGSAPATVLVLQVGGVAADGTLFQSEDFPVLTSGQRYLIFLTPSSIAGEFCPVGAPQGVFSISATGGVDSYSSLASQVGVSVHGLPLNQVVPEVLRAPNLNVTP